MRLLNIMYINSTKYDTNNTMPFLYFAVEPKCRNLDFVYAKFGNTSDCSKRFKTYGPACKFASVKYDSKISKNTPLDNYINNNVLNKNSFHPLVDFWKGEKSKRKTDWFTMYVNSADRILSYMENADPLRENKDYMHFSRHLSYILIMSHEEFAIKNSFANLHVSSKDTRIKELAVDVGCSTIHASDNSIEFLIKNFKEGGTMPIKDMTTHPDWKQKYRHQIKTKRVHTCIWCKLKAQNGCCDKYSSEDRIKVTMVVGWHQDEDA